MMMVSLFGIIVHISKYVPIKYFLTYWWFKQYLCPCFFDAKRDVDNFHGHLGREGESQD